MVMLAVVPPLAVLGEEIEPSGRPKRAVRTWRHTDFLYDDSYGIQSSDEEVSDSAESSGTEECSDMEVEDQISHY